MALIRCDECGNEVSDRAASCPGCGAPVGGGVAIQQLHVVAVSKSKSAAAFLAFFFGGLGIHKFYLDMPGWGLLYVIFCWTFIPMILGFVEGLNYVFMSEETFQERFCS